MNRDGKRSREVFAVFIGGVRFYVVLNLFKEFALLISISRVENIGYLLSIVYKHDRNGDTFVDMRLQAKI
jgi:hypothetical protein